jgi:hypothetical protein
MRHNLLLVVRVSPMSEISAISKLYYTRTRGKLMLVSINNKMHEQDDQDVDKAGWSSVCLTSIRKA